MEDDWLQLCASLGVSVEASRLAFDRLAAAYASPGRAYHTFVHIRAILQTLRPLTDDPALLLAAWFHDAIYDSRAKDNEERSADFAAEVLADMSVAADVIAEVRRLILLTKTHDPADADHAGQLLVDADLAILGTESAEYQRYAAAIREEYAWVPEEAYRAGRRTVLENFLLRPRIYRTAALAGLAAAARRNLAAEVAALKSATDEHR